MYRPVLVTPPDAAVSIVSRTEAKKHCRVDFDDDNEVIDAFIAAAVAHLDGWTGILGRCLVEQTWRQDFDEIWDCARLPLFPVISITSITYRDTSNVQQMIDAGNYSLQIDELGGFVRYLSTYSPPSTFREKPAVSVTYKAGYANGDGPVLGTDFPKSIKQAILLLVGHWYNNREAAIPGLAGIAKLPFAVEALLAPYRRMKF